MCKNGRSLAPNLVQSSKKPQKEKNTRPRRGRHAMHRGNCRILGAMLGASFFLPPPSHRHTAPPTIACPPSYQKGVTAIYTQGYFDFVL